MGKRDRAKFAWFLDGTLNAEMELHRKNDYEDRHLWWLYRETGKSFGNCEKGMAHEVYGE